MMKDSMGRDKMAENMEDENGEPMHYEDHQVQSAADDIMRAERHKAKPRLMEHVKKHMEMGMKAVTPVKDMADLKKRRNESFKKSPMPGAEEPDTSPTSDEVSA